MPSDVIDWEELDVRRKVFHKHLDVCRYCVTHPFDLCGIGDLLLRAAMLQPPLLELVPPDEENK